MLRCNGGNSVSLENRILKKKKKKKKKNLSSCLRVFRRLEHQLCIVQLKRRGPGGVTLSPTTINAASELGAALILEDKR